MTNLIYFIAFALLLGVSAGALLIFMNTKSIKNGMTKLYFIIRMVITIFLIGSFILSWGSILDRRRPKVNYKNNNVGINIGGFHIGFNAN